MDARQDTLDEITTCAQLGLIEAIGIVIQAGQCSLGHLRPHISVSRVTKHMQVLDRGSTHFIRIALAAIDDQRSQLVQIVDRLGQRLDELRQSGIAIVSNEAAHFIGKHLVEGALIGHCFTAHQVKRLDAIGAFIDLCNPGIAHQLLLTPLDLLGRKVLMTQGKTMRAFTKQVHKFCQANEGHAQLGDYINQLSTLNAQWGEQVHKIGMKAMQNRDEIGAASMDFLMYSGYVTLAFLWLKMAVSAQAELDAGSSEKDFYQAKLATQAFYFKRLLPRAQAHLAALESGADNLMDIAVGQF